MHTLFSRRGFLARGLPLSGAGLAWAACAPGQTWAAAPPERTGSARLRLGLAAYSFRSYFIHGRDGSASPISSEQQMDMFRFIDYCAEQGCDGAEVTSYYFPKDVTDETLMRLKRHAFMRGVALSGTAIGNTFTVPAGQKRLQEMTRAKEWIDRAARLGAPHVRVFAGSAEGEGKSQAQALKWCVEALQECCAYAAQRGVMLGLENHGGIVAEADALLEIMHAVNSPWLGINLDTGNFHTGDPYADLARCAPWAVNVQLKTDIRPRNGTAQPADLKRLVRMLRDVRYQGYVTLEYEASENPWTAVPRILKELKEALRVS